LASVPGIYSHNPWPGVRVIYAPNDDALSQIPPREVLHKAVQAAHVVAEDLGSGRNVLVTCWQGRNRSGLVSALSLHLYADISGEDAADVVRSKRRRSLSNPVFCELLYRIRPISTALRGSRA